MGGEVKKKQLGSLRLFVPLLLILVHIPLLGKTVRVGYFNKKPIACYNKNGKSTGLAIDILNDIARKNRWKLIYVKGSFPQGVNRLISGKIDLMMPIGYNQERDKKFDYSSEGILQSWGCLFTKRGGQVRSIPDVKGKRIAYVKKSLFYEKFRKLIAGFGVKCDFVEVANYSKLLRGVAETRFDGGIGDRLAIIGFNRYVAKQIDASIVFSPFSLHLAVASGDPLSILPKINDYLVSGKDKANSAYSGYKNKWLLGVVDSDSSLSLSLVFFLFVIIFLGYFLSRLPVIRKALGLAEVVESRVSFNVLVVSWFLALFVWVMDALITYFWFNLPKKSFLMIFTTFSDSHELVMRFFYTVPILLGGIMISRVMARLAKQYRLAQESSENYRITLNSIGDGVVTTDTAGRVTQINPVAQQLMGLSDEEACGELLNDIFNIVNATTKKVVDNPVGKVLSLGKVVGLANHTVLISKDGNEYQIADSAAPIRDVDDKIIGVVLVFRDVTEEYRMEEMMIQGEKMLSVGGLAAGMAHEINNPLAGMMQTADVMATRLAGDTKVAANLKAAQDAGIDMQSLGRYMDSRGILRMLKTIHEAGQRVADIVNNMLSFVRKSDNLKLLQNIEDIVNKTIELAATDYDLKKKYDFKLIEIKKEYEANIPFVACEGSMIQQVLLNIFRNGAQAMEMAKIDSPQFIVRTRYDKERSMVVIEVEDNGLGMDEVTRKRVFEPFFTTKPVGVGTGLGLSVSYFIIKENNGGELVVESEPGKGAKFIISLPVEVL